MGGGAPGPPKHCEGRNREEVPSPGHRWARSDQTVSPGTTEETSAKGLSFAQEGKMAPERKLEE